MALGNKIYYRINSRKDKEGRMYGIRQFFYGSALLLFLLIGAGCSNRSAKVYSSREIATSWAEMTLYVTKNTPANSPTYASRALGYIGLTMYESIVPGFEGYNSLAGQLNGLEELPVPDRNAGVDWTISLNAGQALILKRLYNQTSDANKLMIDSLEQVFFRQLAAHTAPEGVVERSVAYGRSVAEAIFEWSKTDGGHRGYLYNFDKDLKAPVFPGSWEPPLYAQSISHYPLHPHWGKNRPFIKDNVALPFPEMIGHDTDRNSGYYNQFLAVYEKNKVLTQEEKEAALWWGDDPSDTFTPPGHSYYLATTVIKIENPDLISCAETYARVGLAVADAFITCWKWKYHFFSERPSSFLNKTVEPGWESFWPDPPFPAFPSGHAIQAAATATVLSDLYGEAFTFTDSAHVGREKDEIRDVEFKPRTFTSFWQVARETADSRFYGGIHTPQDNEVGLAEGAVIGENVNELKWREQLATKNSID